MKGLRAGCDRRIVEKTAVPLYRLVRAADLIQSLRGPPPRLRPRRFTFGSFVEVRRCIRVPMLFPGDEAAPVPGFGHLVLESGGLLEPRVRLGQPSLLQQDAAGAIVGEPRPIARCDRSVEGPSRLLRSTRPLERFPVGREDAPGRTERLQCVLKDLQLACWTRAVPLASRFVQNDPDRAPALVVLGGVA